MSALPAPQERYVTIRELAELMGVSERTIRRMAADGMPSENWGMSRTRRFLPSKAIAWAQNRTVRNAADRSA
jgi:excisionase family DNA binding protein